MSRVEYRIATRREETMYLSFAENRNLDKMTELLSSAGPYVFWGPAFRALMPRDQEWVKLVQRELVKT